MSRKYLNDRWCVRCGKTDPTPYLRDNWWTLIPHQRCGLYVPEKVAIPMCTVLDIGCGNGRNLKFMREMGFGRVGGAKCIGCDMAKGCPGAVMMTLGQDRLPADDKSVDIILCNYLLMFLRDFERQQVIGEIKRVASKHCAIMVELYPAKDSVAKTEAAALKLQKEIFDALGWVKVRWSKLRFIARTP